MSENRNAESNADFKNWYKVSSSVVGLKETKVTWELEDCQNSLGRLAAVAKCEMGVSSCNTTLHFSLQETTKSLDIANGRKNVEVTWLSLAVAQKVISVRRKFHQGLEIRVHSLDENGEITSTFPTMYTPVIQDGITATDPVVLREEFIYVAEVTKDEFGMEIERHQAEQPSVLRYGIIVVPLQHTLKNIEWGQSEIPSGLQG